MPLVEVFSRFEIPPSEVFRYISNSDNLFRTPSFFYSIENLSSSNSKINQNTSFTQKCVFSDLLNLFYTVKEIVPDEKIVFQFNGLIKGQEYLDVIKNDENTIVKDKIEFSTFNNFSLPFIDIILCTVFHIDTLVKHLRFKNLVYKERPSQLKKNGFIGELLTIRSYAVVNASVKQVEYLFEDLNMLALLSPYIGCKVIKKKDSKIVASFSIGPFNGVNTLLFLKHGDQVILENKFEINQPNLASGLTWLVLGNTIIRNIAGNLNKKLKELVPKIRSY